MEKKEKKKLSRIKALVWFIAICAFIYRKEISRRTAIAMRGLWESVLRPVGRWFAESLGEIRNFPKGAQAAIAFLTIVALVTLSFRLFTDMATNKENKEGGE